MASCRRSPVAVAALVVGLVGLGALGLRSAGLLESQELAAYDWYIRLRPFDPPPDSRILIVGITEEDIQRQGTWPLPDGVLADAMESLARFGPRAMGLDIYRDISVPPGTEKLREVLRRDGHIVGVMKFGAGPSDGVAAPPSLKGTDRVGFNDVLVDTGGTVRRGLLFLDDGTTAAPALALRLALLYMAPEGVTAQPDERDPQRLKLGRTSIRPFEGNDGGYVGADAHGYQFLLDFKGARRPLRSVPLTDVLSGTVDPAAVRDKVVLIGVTAESVTDDFYTPLTRGRQANEHITGVALHGLIVSQLLRMGLDGASPLATPSDWEEAIWIILWGVAGGAIGLRIRSPLRFSLACGAAVLGLGGFDFVAFGEGWWLPLVPAALTCLISAAVLTAYVSYRETVQRAVLMQLFSRHVAREVAETIWQHRDEFLDGGRPRSQRLTVTALFTDLTGFTTVSEKHSPEALMEWLNEYMDAMAQQVSRHGGVIRQYAGDSVVVMFGVPVARTTEGEVAADAVAAVNCALAMELTLRDLNRRWREQGRPQTGMRIGIFTGPVVAGTLGSAERSEYVVVGDTMNTAARLENFDKTLFPPDPDEAPCRILIGDPTLGYVGDRFETERVGDVTLKGKELRVGVYRVIGRASEPRAEALSEERPG